MVRPTEEIEADLKSIRVGLDEARVFRPDAYGVKIWYVPSSGLAWVGWPDGKRKGIRAIGLDKADFRTAVRSLLKELIGKSVTRSECASILASRGQRL